MTNALSGFAPVTRGETLAARVREELRSAIMAGRFQPGEKLTLRAVAAALDVSLTPAREALYNLASEGALEAGPNGSIYVPRLDRGRIAEIAKIRVALEGLAAREAAPRLDGNAIAEIVALNEALEQADGRGDYASLIRLNWAFHFRLYDGAGMPALRRMIESCWLMTGSYLNLIYPTFGLASTGIRNHREIIAALTARDAERLMAAVARDIEFASAAMEDVAEAMEAEADEAPPERRAARRA